jgi:hypothetical protein
MKFQQRMRVSSYLPRAARLAKSTPDASSSLSSKNASSSRSMLIVAGKPTQPDHPRGFVGGPPGCDYWGPQRPRMSKYPY